MRPTDTLSLLYAAAAQHYNTTRADILSQARPARLVHIRHAIIAHLAAAHPTLTHGHIAHYFHRDRTAICHALINSRNLISTRDTAYLEIHETLGAALGAPSPLRLLYHAAHEALTNPGNNLTEATRHTLRTALAAAT